MIGAYIPWTDSPRGTAGYVIDGNGCHVWVGAITPGGYGVAWDQARKKNSSPHRVRYEQEVGPIPEGMQLDHFVCENKACCNPAHLRPVTGRENVLRGATVPSANAAMTHCTKGHPLSGDNLVVCYAKIGVRRCRKCSNQYARDLRRARASQIVNE